MTSDIDRVVTWLVVLIISWGIFLAITRFLRWYREVPEKKPAGPVRLSEILERRQP